MDKDRNNWVRWTVAGVALGWLFPLVLPAHAGYYALTNGDSYAAFDPNPSPGITEFGQYEWAVDGVEVCHQQWFWYRVAGDPAVPLQDIAGGSLVSATPSDTNSDGQNDKLVLLYANPQINITVSFQLQGGAINSGVASMAESLTISNKAAFSLSMTIFQYANFDLYDVGGDVAQVLAGGDTLQQTDATHNITATTKVSPKPTHFEVAPYGNGSNSTLFDKLQNDNGTFNLNDNAGPDGPGDETSAFQWDFTVGAGGSFQIDLTKDVSVPEPGSFVLTALGLMGFALLRRRA